jgi:hypothetical protein
MQTLYRLIRAANVLVWACVGLVVLAAAGQMMLGEPARVRLDVAKRRELDGEIRRILAEARGRAEADARVRVAAIVAQMKARVEPEFLDGYFGYLHQQKLGLNALWYGVRRRLDEQQPGAQERLAETFRAEFASRVVKPELSSLFLRRVNERAVDGYLSHVRMRVAALPAQYAIPQPEWERYLEDLGALGARPEANREVPLTLKALVVTATPFAVWAGVRLVAVMRGAGTRLVGLSAARVATGAAARVGGAAAARMGGRMLGPILGAALLAWDALDHHATVSTQKPLLARHLTEYLDAMAEDLVVAPGSGVMSAIDALEAELVKGLSRAPSV